ncbi:MAG: glycogen/starch/alpha-glucan phosphorylase, partial [Bacteroidales bacterium]|nr:glycogen/starch/alpha-glucan phosphorylase [Bacteroidales bacterium]
SALMNISNAGKFSSDRTIEQYVDEIWHLDKVPDPHRPFRLRHLPRRHQRPHQLLGLRLLGLLLQRDLDGEQLSLV